VRGLGPFENLVDIARGAPVQVSLLGAVRKEAAGVHKLSRRIDRGKTMCRRQVDDASEIALRQRVVGDDEGICALLGRGVERASKVLGMSHVQKLRLESQRSCRYV